MENFYISAKVVTPVIASGFLTLDSILAALMFKATNDFDYSHTEIPLEKTSGVWHGSQANFTMTAVRTLNSSFIRSLRTSEMEDPKYSFKARANSSKSQHFIDQGRNDPKHNHQWRAMVSSMPAIEPGVNGKDVYVYWFGRGDVDKVKHILKDLLFVGSKINSGYGQISDVDITVIDKDYSIISENGTPARPVPVDFWNEISANKNVGLKEASFRPPYFKSKKVVCAIPTARIFD